MIIEFEGKKYRNIDRMFDLSRGCIDLKNNTKYLTNSVFSRLPISPHEYRLKSPTHAKVTYVATDRDHMFILTDDWGVRHSLKISRTKRSDALVRKQLIKCEAEGLMGINQTAL